MNNLHVHVFLYLKPKLNKHKTTCSVEHSCCSGNIAIYNVKHTWDCPLFTPLGGKIRKNYSNDLNPFGTWALQQCYKFCVHSKVSCDVGHDLKARILWQIAMILSSDKLNWSQGIGGWLINLQPDPEYILYKIFFPLERHVTPLSVNTTSCLVYLNWFGRDFILVMVNTSLSITCFG